MEDSSSHNGGRERLGLSFTIDYLLFNKGVKGSKEEPSGSRPTEETGDEEQEEGEEEVTTTTSTSGAPEKSPDKPNQSYIALISKAILASEQKKLLLCDIYQWIMDHYPYFRSKDKNWRNSVRHNLSLNDCFIKAGRSDNGKGHFWAIHPSNYQDFSNGDYHCRRARRRVRREARQVPFASLSSPYHPAIIHPHRTACWCCPQAPTHPLSCLAPRLYWPWSTIHPQVGLYPGMHGSVPKDLTF
uniref:Forkhead box Q2 n=1 Tax=Sphaeramia orbicularis TaxID=375764 RepID=A0A672YKF9_9TELE